MLGRRNRKKEIVRIDVDWLLGESTKPSTRDFSWFKRAIICLTFVSLFVWSWPYASKAWLKWEWQQQLAQLSGKQSDDVLPIMLALKELNPTEVEPVAVLPPNESSAIAMAPMESASISAKPAIAQLSDTYVEAPQIAKLGPASPNTRMRINDSGFDDSNTLDPPSLRPLETSSTNFGSQSNENETFPTSMRTPMDEASSSGVRQLPNLSLTIPRTVNKAIVVPAPAISPEPIAEMTPNSASANVIQQSQESTAIRGIEKLPIEKLLPLLNSVQPRFVQQAFDELARRGMLPPQFEIAIALANGDVKQRLAAMDAIARDPNFEDSLAWLVWMAESADLDVRRRAVALLGSMTEPNARRKLRILLAKEPDGPVADQINRVLLASGTASISVR